MFSRYFKFYVLPYFCKLFTGAVEITAKRIQVYEVKKHEKKKGHWSENNIDPDISFNKEKIISFSNCWLCYASKMQI